MLLGSLYQMLVKLVTNLFCSLVKLFGKTFAPWKPELKRDLFMHFFSSSILGKQVISAYGLLAKRG